MTKSRHTSTLHVALLALLVAAGSCTPATLQAQDTSISQEHMTRIARAHLEINDARDEFHGKVARVHDAEGRNRAREEVEARIEAILTAESITREQYDETILRISLDGELRTMFEEAIVAIEAERSGD